MVSRVLWEIIDLVPPPPPLDPLPPSITTTSLPELPERNPLLWYLRFDDLQIIFVFFFFFQKHMKKPYSFPSTPSGLYYFDWPIEKKLVCLLQITLFNNNNKTHFKKTKKKHFLISTIVFGWKKTFSFFFKQNYTKKRNKLISFYLSILPPKLWCLYVLAKFYILFVLW